MSCIQCPKEDPEAKVASVMPCSQGGIKSYLLIKVKSIVQLHLTKEMRKFSLTS